MANATISTEKKDGTIKTIYCHNVTLDIGKILLENYNSKKLAKELIKRGNCSSLGNTLEETTFYGSEITLEYKTYKDIDLKDFNYLFSFKTKEWYLLDNLGKLEKIKLKDPCFSTYDISYVLKQLKEG